MGLLIPGLVALTVLVAFTDTLLVFSGKAALGLLSTTGLADDEDLFPELTVGVGFRPGIKLAQFNRPNKAYWPIPTRFDVTKYSDNPEARVSASQPIKKGI